MPDSDVQQLGIAEGCWNDAQKEISKSMDSLAHYSVFNLQSGKKTRVSFTGSWHSGSISFKKNQFHGNSLMGFVGIGCLIRVMFWIWILKDLKSPEMTFNVATLFLHTCHTLLKLLLIGGFDRHGPHMCGHWLACCRSEGANLGIPGMSKSLGKCLTDDHTSSFYPRCVLPKGLFFFGNSHVFSCFNNFGSDVLLICQDPQV